MADIKGFLTTPRQAPARRPVDVRIQDWREVYTEFGRGGHFAYTTDPDLVVADLREFFGGLG